MEYISEFSGPASKLFMTTCYLGSEGSPTATVAFLLEEDGFDFPSKIEDGFNFPSSYPFGTLIYPMKLVNLRSTGRFCSLNFLLLLSVIAPLWLLANKESYV